MNRFFWQSFQSEQQSICSQLDDKIYVPRVQNYIREVVGTVEALLGKKCIESVILFGSVAQNSTVKISDVDLLIIVRNEIASSQIRKIEPILKGLEIKHRFAHRASNWVTKILWIVEKTTGMFCSHFISRKRDWDHNRFAQIFSTNRFMTTLLAPDRIVLGSVIDSAKELYGSVLPATKHITHVSIYQLVKSLLMDLIISLGTIAILPLRHQNINYSTESLKWALRSGIFYLFQKTYNISKSCQFFEHIGLPAKFIDRFLMVRQNPHLDIGLALSVPLMILKIHLLSFHYKKIVKLAR
jgi:predicted nucleotidyltransferase